MPRRTSLAFCKFLSHPKPVCDWNKNSYPSNVMPYFPASRCSEHSPKLWGPLETLYVRFSPGSLLLDIESRFRYRSAVASPARHSTPCAKQKRNARGEKEEQKRLDRIAYHVRRTCGFFIWELVWQSRRDLFQSKVERSVLLPCYGATFICFP